MSDSSTAADRTRETGRILVADADGTVTVRKLVSKGERLEIESDDDDSIKLDSLLLEGLSWQTDRRVIRAHADDEGVADDDPVPETGGTPVESAPELTISNEYSHTTIRKVVTDDGEAVRIRTPGRGTSLNLGARTLRTLAAVPDTYAFSNWFETPFGPEDAPLEGPL